MELGPIFRALAHSKGRFWLIAVEIALTLAVVVNCLNMIVDQRRMVTRDSGMDEENVLVVVSEPYAPEFREIPFARDMFHEDLRALRALPGVIAASATYVVPLSGSGSWANRSVQDSEIETGGAYITVAPDFFESMGVELAMGRDFIETDFPIPGEPEDEQEESEKTELRNVLVTQAYADDLVPDGDPLGAVLTRKDGEPVERIVGVISKMHGPWLMSSKYAHALVAPGEPFSRRRTRFVVRAEPSMVESLYGGVEQTLLGLNEGRIITVRTLAEVEYEGVKDIMAVGTMLGFVSALLIAVTCLGVIGLTSFSVTKRTKEIGTRRALGATRLAVLRYFLVENWVLTSIGMTFGVGVTYGLNYTLAEIADVTRLELSLVVWGMLLLWGVGLLSALVPALRGTAVPPVVATRTV